MTFGHWLLWASGVALVGSLVSYLRGGNSPATVTIGHRLFHAMTALLTVALFYLLYLFLTDHFEFSYVAGYSARHQELFYKISALWAGQEGTFLLWAWITAVLGLFIIRRGGPLMTRTMIYYLGCQLFLLLLMYVRSPFALLPAANIPLDGRGLNPLLKDPWMVIHPPIVFLGYAVFTVPFCYALAALDQRKWRAFAAAALPWTGFAVATLGAGIFIGGFWAYKVLGWGGYWGWDPVENASLIPWLTGLALIHSLLILRGSGKLLKSTVGLALVSYVLVIYGTFLTRSGVLAEFSVHSFTDLGLNAYLIGFLVLISLYSLVRLVQGTRGEAPPPIATAITSREFSITMSIVVLSLTAVLVWLGTSTPIFTTIAGNPANVNTGYYNTIALPLAIFLALLLGFSPFLRAERMPWGMLLQSVFPSLVAAAVVTSAVLIFTAIAPMHAILVFASTLAVGSNLTGIIRYSGGNLLCIAGHMTHVGFGIMVLGIVASSGYGSNVTFTIPAGDTVSAYGFDIGFHGIDVDANAEDGYLDLTLTRGDEIISARPRLYVSAYNNNEMRTPFVYRQALYDIYIAPIEHQEFRPANVIHLTKGETSTFKDWTLTFERFDAGTHEGTGGMRVGAVITAVRAEDTLEFTPMLESGADGQRPIPLVLPGTGMIFSLTGMSVETGVIELTVDDPAGVEEQPGSALVVDISKKPLTVFVWVGTLLITLGSCLSFWRRHKEAALFT